MLLQNLQEVVCLLAQHTDDDYFLSFFFQIFWCGPFFLMNFKIFIEFVILLLSYVWEFSGHGACEVLAPQPGIRPAPPALKGEVLTSGSPATFLFFISLAVWFILGSCNQSQGSALSLSLILISPSQSPPLLISLHLGHLHPLYLYHIYSIGRKRKFITIHSFIEHNWVHRLYQPCCRCWRYSDEWDWQDAYLQGADGPCYQHSRLPGAHNLFPSQHTRSRTHHPQSSSLSLPWYSLISFGELHRHLLIFLILLVIIGESPWQHYNGQIMSNPHIRHIRVVQICWRGNSILIS